MSDKKKDDARRIVTSVGNSWIVCNSRSHSGHVYYFNTLTGEAVWNLSDAEIEKAKHRTKKLEREPGASLERCPEPREKPPCIPLKISSTLEKQYINPFVFDKVAEQASESFHNIAPFSYHMNQMPMSQHNSQICNPSTVNIIEPLNSSINTQNFQTTSIFNPKVWRIPQTPQFSKASTKTPPVDHTHPPLNVAHNNLPQTVALPAMEAFNNFSNSSQANNLKSVKRKIIYPRHFNEKKVHQNLSKMNLFGNKNDLRQKLHAKKIFQCTNKEFDDFQESGMLGSQQRQGNVGYVTKMNAETHQYNNVQIMETQLREGPSKIDLTPLKCLAPSNTKSDAWFIVMDFYLLVREFKFLTTLVDSDQQCHLMVPKRVMSQLKDYVSCSSDIQARRILRFLSQQIDIGYAFMAEDASNNANDSIAEVIHTTCIKLMKNKYHVILLSNDSQLISYRNISDVNIFTLDEVKNLLDNPSNRRLPDVPNKTFMFEKLIEITVRNDTIKTDITNKEIHVHSNQEFTHLSEPTTEEINTQKRRKRLVSKKTVDAGIQTDFEDITAKPNESETLGLMPIPNTSHNERVLKCSSASQVLNVFDKKRKIKLNRSTSNQLPVTSVEGNRKQFKWRRRRNTSPQDNVQVLSHCNHKTQPKSPESQKKHILNEDFHEHTNTFIVNSPIPLQNNHKISEDSIESRDSSISVAGHNINCSKGNITIEETSTSDIISNSESNVDAESNYCHTSIGQQQLEHRDQFCENSMYVIDSKHMEEYLIMKCDEWVSRFIQIMEEVLTQVLHQEPSFVHSAMPPPWTLHEAAQCVAMKFNSHQKISVTANKLSNILFNMSDGKGKITAHVKPYQYMLMYSYGVQLLVAISKELPGCEDIQIAAESLKKLLEDIKNPNCNNGTNDTFIDSLREKSVNEEVESSDSDNENNSTLSVQKSLSNLNQKEVDETPNNLCPKRRKLSKEKALSPVKFVRNIDLKSSFFTNLNLQTTDSSCKTTDVLNENQTTTDLSNRKDTPNNLNTTNEIVENETNSDATVNHQKIIRNFSICAEYEKKLKSTSSYKDNEEELDYEENYGEQITDQYISDDENYITPHSDTNDDELVAAAKTFVHTESGSSNIDHHLNIDNSEKFKYFMYMLIEEIRNALCQVRILCNQCYDELKNLERSTDQAYKLQEMAERAHLHIVRLCRSLESMLIQESDNPTKKLNNILKQADINICHVDNKLLFEYRITVANCKDYAYTFLNSILCIMSAFKG